MEWLLMIVLMSEPDDAPFEPVRFASEAECVEAARAFVERHPVFEWRDPADETAVTRPVLRSYVHCVPAADYESAS